MDPDYEARLFARNLITRPNQALPIVKYCYQHSWMIKKLIKKLFTAQRSLSLSGFAFQLIQSLLIRVIKFPNWCKKNALACDKLVRK